MEPRSPEHAAYGLALRSFRNEVGLSQEQLAHEAELTEATSRVSSAATGIRASRTSSSLGTSSASKSPNSHERPRKYFPTRRE
jgi:hypothetical protein